KALVCPTQSGKTARLISSHRPQVPVLALSPRIETVRRCAMYWGVRAELNEEPEDTTALLELCAAAAKRARLCEPGDKVGVTAGCTGSTEACMRWAIRCPACTARGWPLSWHTGPGPCSAIGMRAIIGICGVVQRAAWMSRCQADRLTARRGSGFISCAASMPA